MQGFRFELLENIKSWSDVLLYIKFQIPNFCRKEEFGHSQKTPLSWGQVEAASLDVNLYTSFAKLIGSTLRVNLTLYRVISSVALLYVWLRKLCDDNEDDLF